jgi:hypothetical protein
MRSTSTAHRGWFGLIRKGSGAVQGIARLVDVGAPLTEVGMLDGIDLHRIPAERILSGEVVSWNTPWILADVRRLEKPVPYRHRNGAVTWVSLDDGVAEAIAGQLDGLVLSSVTPPSVAHAAIVPADRQAANRTSPPLESRPARSGSGSPPVGGQWIGEIEINEANLRNNHFYLRPLVHSFPDDVIGGSNRSEAAQNSVSLDWGGPTETQTDIDGRDKKFFRARGWVGAFYKLHGAEPGDRVTIEQTAPYRYAVRLRKRPA